MRIAYVITRSDDLGGAQIHVRDLASRLRQSDHDVVVLAGGGGVLARQLKERGVQVVTLRHMARVNPRARSMPICCRRSWTARRVMMPRPAMPTTRPRPR